MRTLHKLVWLLAPLGVLLMIGAAAWGFFKQPLPGGTQVYVIVGGSLVLLHLLLAWEAIANALGRRQMAYGAFSLVLVAAVLGILAGLVNVAGIWIYASSSPEWKPAVTGALGLFLLGACFLAMGTFISTLTKNQIVAGILSFCLFLGMWTLGWADDPTAGPVMKAVAYLGVTTHLEDLVKGVVDLKDVVFYLSVISFGLFLAHQSVESQRWRA